MILKPIHNLAYSNTFHLHQAYIAKVTDISLLKQKVTDICLKET